MIAAGLGPRRERTVRYADEESDITSVSPEQVRRLISGVPQDPHVFSGTVRDNLRLAAPDAHLAAVLDRVRLADLPVDMEAGVGGTRLSGGMRQRIAGPGVADRRANPRARRADHPSRPATRDALLDDVLALDRTVVLITHDPAGLDRFDEAGELGGGRTATRRRRCRRRPPAPPALGTP